jgi:hypothetical protein
MACVRMRIGNKWELGNGDEACEIDTADMASDPFQSASEICGTHSIEPG